MNWQFVVWVYVGLPPRRGVIRLRQSQRARCPLIASVGSARWPDRRRHPAPIVAPVVLGLLVVQFIVRVAKTKKFVPAGMLLVIDFSPWRRP